MPSQGVCRELEMDNVGRDNMQRDNMVVASRENNNPLAVVPTSGMGRQSVVLNYPQNTGTT